ncbi:MAG: MOSC domain-containing protein [Pseudomonadota bacterium]
MSRERALHHALSLSGYTTSHEMWRKTFAFMAVSVLLTLAELQARFAAPGQVMDILLRPARDVPMVRVDEAEISAAGLAGDRARPGKRAVTLIQAEHLPVVAALAGLDNIDPALLRRNIVVAGLNLLAFRGKQVRVGSALLEFTVPAHPCSKMEAVLGEGGYTAMRGHGGICANVVSDGLVTVGDGVTPV